MATAQKRYRATEEKKTVNYRLPGKPEWERAWQQGRWSQDLCDAAWYQADSKPTAGNLHTALKVQHALSGLQPHHLNFAQHLISELRNPWQAVTVRLLCARLQLKQYETAQSVLDQMLTGSITLLRARLLAGFPLALAFIQQQQPDRLRGRLFHLAKIAQQLQRSSRQVSPATIQSLSERNINQNFGNCRVAVVGNAPCLLNSRDGQLIDEHDVVVRFNAADVSERYRKQTGSRTDLWVVSPALPSQQQTLPSKALAISGVNPLAGQSGYWKSLHKRGIPLMMQFSQRHWYALVSELGAPPSAGLLVLRSLALEPSNLEINAFGFTRTENLNDQSEGAHYSDTNTGSRRHNWQAEAHWFSRTFTR